MAKARRLAPLREQGATRSEGGAQVPCLVSRDCRPNVFELHGTSGRAAGRCGAGDGTGPGVAFGLEVWVQGTRLSGIRGGTNRWEVLEMSGVHQGYSRISWENVYKEGFGVRSLWTKPT